MMARCMFGGLSGAVLAMMIGALLASLIPLSIDAWRDSYDATHPVWRFESVDVVEWQDGGLRIDNLVGTKERDCSLRRFWGQVEFPGFQSLAAVVLRPDGSVIQNRKLPLGRNNIGAFLIAPVPTDATGVSLWGEYKCGDRDITNLIARINLRGHK